MKTHLEVTHADVSIESLGVSAPWTGSCLEAGDWRCIE